MDFKQTGACDKLGEHAKDIAAMANWLGGVIIFGATHEDGVLSYSGVSAAHGAKLLEAVQQANVEYCLPQAKIDPRLISQASGAVLLAVNVDPSTLLVGVRVQKTIDTPWRFPVRVGSHTTYLSPGDHAMVSDPRARRSFILTESIPADERDLLYIHSTEVNGAFVSPLKARRKATLLRVDQLGVGVRVDSATFDIPLREILDVWRSGPSREWNIAVDGCISSGSYAFRAR